MRVFSIVGLLITLVIVGWLSATYLAAVTGRGGLPNDPAVSSQGGGTESSGMDVTTSPIDRARELASMDRERQRQMENFIQQQNN
jgi:hypothetical protein